MFNVPPASPASVRLTNRSTVIQFLGRVNLLSIAPSLILVLGILAAGLGACRTSGAAGRLDVQRFAVVFVLSTLALYVWFLMRYPNRGIGDMVKATYTLQTYVFVALLAGERLSALAARHRWIFWLIVALWIAITLHSMPTFFTHYR